MLKIQVVTLYSLFFYLFFAGCYEADAGKSLPGKAIDSSPNKMIDIRVEGVPENVEETVGAFVPVNDNDDNGDGNVDCEYDKESMNASQYDRIPIHISIAKELKNPQTGINKKQPLTLEIPNKSNGFRIWESATGKKLLINQAGSVKFDSAEKVPSTIWLDAGGKNRKTSSIYLNATWNGQRDVIKFNSFRTDLKISGLKDEKEKIVKGKVKSIAPFEEKPGYVINMKNPETLITYFELFVYGQNLPKEHNEMQLIWHADDKISVYSSKLNGTEYVPDEMLSSGHVFPGNDKGTVFLVKVNAESKRKNDVELISCYISPVNEAMHEDTIKLTVKK